MIKVVSKNKTSVYKRLPIFVSGKSTFTVQDEYSTTISNSATFNLFPEILDMGYEKSISAGINVGWSKYNDSNTPKQLVILKVYDVVRITTFSNYSNGHCTVGSDKTYNIAKGWAFDLR